MTRRELLEVAIALGLAAGASVLGKHHPPATVSPAPTVCATPHLNAASACKVVAMPSPTPVSHIIRRNPFHYDQGGAMTPCSALPSRHSDTSQFVQSLSQKRAHESH